MALLALGINHKTASVDVREKVAFSPEKLTSALHEAEKLRAVSEVAILSTCNRTEIYCVAENGGEQQLLEWMSACHGVSLPDLSACCYVHWDEDAARHMMSVACGLDSMVLGEPQILGQLKTAYHVARDAGTTGTLLNRLFQSSFSVAKQVRTETAIGENPVSVAYAAVTLAGRIFSNMAENRALLIGAGETIELVARHLYEVGIRDITVANRTVTRARDLAKEFSGKAIALGEIADVLPEADIVIASTASPYPVLGKGAVERAIRIRKHKPMFMVDIAVPRDIEPQVRELEDVYLYTVDDLNRVINENIRSREGAAEEARHLVESGAAHFMSSLRERSVANVLTTFRGQAYRLMETELDKSLRSLERGAPADKVLREFARSFSNKLLHTPTIKVRQAASEGREEVSEWIAYLFDLPLSASVEKPETDGSGSGEKK